MSTHTTDQPIIRLQNTKTRRREEFLPLDPNRIGIYLCGPTVYDRAHLGNARPVLMFDVLYRLLRQAYGADHVVYVRNFTDVDDKINARAAEAGREIGDITAETIRWYHEDMDALGALRPDHEPRATDFIGAMVDMIRELIARGHAYEAEGHVLFAVDSYPEYGAVGPFTGRYDRRCPGRSRAIQARSDGFRTVEAVWRRSTWMGQPLGRRPPRLAYRMLCHVPRAAGPRV
jgi:cysteinyl-tRNA synthetase